MVGDADQRKWFKGNSRNQAEFVDHKHGVTVNLNLQGRAVEGKQGSRKIHTVFKFPLLIKAEGLDYMSWC